MNLLRWVRLRRSTAAFRRAYDPFIDTTNVSDDDIAATILKYRLALHEPASVSRQHEVVHAIVDELERCGGLRR